MLKFDAVALVNAGSYIRYESFFVSLQKETHETHNT